MEEQVTTFSKETEIIQKISSILVAKLIIVLDNLIAVMGSFTLIQIFHLVEPQLFPCKMNLCHIMTKKTSTVTFH